LPGAFHFDVLVVRLAPAGSDPGTGLKEGGEGKVLEETDTRSRGLYHIVQMMEALADPDRYESVQFYRLYGADIQAAEAVVAEATASGADPADLKFARCFFLTLREEHQEALRALYWDEDTLGVVEKLARPGKLLEVFAKAEVTLTITRYQMTPPAPAS
jgi:hypothetical protein